MTGSLCFEQNYGGIEGDSASGAELAALLSALSRRAAQIVPRHHRRGEPVGQIMAVGGVSRKIEGFFGICSRRGLTGERGSSSPVTTWII